MFRSATILCPSILQFGFISLIFFITFFSNSCPCGKIEEFKLHRNDQLSYLLNVRKPREMTPEEMVT
jgi:hypothetical protein